MLALATSIACVDVFLTETAWQQPQGIHTSVAIDTLLNASAAAGVEMASVDKSGSPSIAIASDIAPAVPPSGTAILPLNSTLYFALQVLVAPLMLINPLPVLCEIYPLLHTDVGVSANNTFPFTATVCVATFENSAIIFTSLS